MVTPERRAAVLAHPAQKGDRTGAVVVSGWTRMRGLIVSLAILGLSLGAPVLFAASASAITYGLNFRNYDPGDLEIAKRSGATIFRADLDFTCTGGGSNWSQFDPIVEAAWKRGIAILPIMVRSYPACEAAEHKRFLNSGDGNWGAWGPWAKAAVERYGINGSFWNGKANPTPITAWEVGNEPNLAQNNPGGAVVQPQAYGKFLKYTAEAIQAGAIAKTSVTTQILSGGLYMQGGYYFGSFLENMGNSGSYTGVGIHPYSFASDFTGLTEEINNVRYVLDHYVPGGGAKSLWITEMGWAVPPATGPYPPGGHSVSEDQQATLLNQSFDWIEGVAGAYQIPLVTWYKIQDQSTSGTHWDEHTGLRRFDGSFRPAWYAFQAQTGAPSWPPPSYPDELGFIRYNAASTHLDTYLAGPTYKTLGSISDTGYPKITDPQNVQGMAIDWSGDGIDELGFLRFNPAGPNAHLDTYVGAPNYKTLASNCDTAYPKVTDPQNLQALPIDWSNATGDELGVVRFNAASGNAHLDTYIGGPCYGTLASISDTGYPAINDPQNVQALALDTNGDGIDELGFLRLNSPNNAHLDTYGGAPSYKTPLAFCNTAYPTVNDPENVQAMAIDWNGDGIDELGFLRFNPATLNAHLDTYTGAPCYQTLASSSDVSYPKISDPQNVQALALNWNTSSYDPPPTWGGGSLGGQVKSDPDIASWGPGRLDVFAKGTDSTLWHKAYSATTWFPWDVVPNSAGLTSGPGAVSWGPGRIDAVARVGKEAVQHWWFDNGTGAWNTDPLGGSITSDPDIASWEPNRLDIFARGADGSLAHRAWVTNTWFPWDKIPNSSGLGSGPGAVSWSQGRLDMVAKDEKTEQVRHWWFDNSVGAWNSEAPWPVKVGSDPDISSWGPNRLDVFAKGPENGLIHKYWNGAGWSGWESLGGPPLTSGPAAVSWGKDRIDVVARVEGDNVYRWYYVDP